MRVDAVTCLAVRRMGGMGKTEFALFGSKRRFLGRGKFYVVELFSTDLCSMAMSVRGFYE